MALKQRQKQKMRVVPYSNIQSRYKKRKKEEERKMRIAFVAVVIVLAVGALVPSAKAKSVILQGALVSAAVAWVAWATWKADQAEKTKQARTTTLMPAESRSAGRFAPVDAEMYGLRLPGPYQAHSIPTPHLLKRPAPFIRAIKRIVRLGAMNGSVAATTRLVGALEDFFTRSDNAMVRPLDPLSHMTFGTLRDGRATALAALQELGLSVPEVRAGAVRSAERAVVVETTRTMRLLRDHWTKVASPYTRGVAVAAEAAGCDARPVPFDDFTDIAQRAVYGF